MINGAVSLAQLTGLPEVIIGATILSLGTTLPEVFVSVFAAWSGNPGLALGNGVGSIICDTGMILGLTCILARVPVDKFILNRSDFVQVGAATLMVFLSLLAYFQSPENPTLHRWVGVLFLVLLSGYLFSILSVVPGKSRPGGKQHHGLGAAEYLQNTAGRYHRYRRCHPCQPLFNFLCGRRCHPDGGATGCDCDHPGRLWNLSSGTGNRDYCRFGKGIPASWSAISSGPTC